MATTFAGTLPASAAPSQSADLPVHDGGVSQLASCALGHKPVYLEILMDQSGSLQTTDPKGSRVTAAKVVLSGLAEAVDSSGGQLRVNVEVAGFDADYRPGRGWHDVSKKTLPKLLSDAGQFEMRNRGVDTDYVNALQGANESIAAETSAATADRPCKGILWFTDGQLDVHDRTGSYSGRGKDESGEYRFKSWAKDIRLDQRGGGARAVTRAGHVLCDANGVADQLHATGTRLIAVPLVERMRAGAIDQLGAIAVGKYQGTTCGVSGSEATGAVLPADSLSTLISNFDDVAQKLADGSRVGGVDTTQVCPKTPCAKGTRTFAIDESLQRFHVLAHTGVAGIEVQITPPHHAPITLNPGETQVSRLGDVALSYRWVARTAVVIDAVHPADAPERNWSGQWKLTFIDRTGKHPDAIARAHIYLFGDLVPKLVGPKAFRMGETQVIAVQVAHRDETPLVDKSFVRHTSVHVVVKDPKGNVLYQPTMRAGPDGRFTGRVSIPNPSRASTLSVITRLDVKTTAGIRLDPTEATFTRRIDPPLSYPIITDDSVHIGPVVGTNPKGDRAVGLVHVKGSPKGDGCVWISGIAFTVVPNEAGGIVAGVEDRHDARSRCVVVKRNKEVVLRVSARPKAATRGTASGTIGLVTSADGNPRVVTTTVDVQLDLRRPVNTGVVLLILFGLLVVGVLFPLLAFKLANQFNAHFEDVSRLSIARVRVRIDDRHVIRDDGQPDPVNFFDFKRIEGVSGRPRTFLALGYQFRSVTPGNPFRPPFGAVSGETVVAGSEPDIYVDDDGRIPLGLGNGWFFAPDAIQDPGDPSLSGSLVAFAESTDILRAVSVLNDELRTHLPLRYHGLQTRVRPDPPLGGDDPWPVSESTDPGHGDRDDIWGQPAPVGGSDKGDKVGRKSRAGRRNRPRLKDRKRPASPTTGRTVDDGFSWDSANRDSTSPPRPPGQTTGPRAAAPGPSSTGGDTAAQAPTAPTPDDDIWN